MQTAIFPGRKLFTAPCLVLILLLVIFFQSCKKTDEAIATKNNEAESRRPPKNPPPPPPTFYFTNCNNPTYSASFAVGVPANTPITKNYVNSPGGSYAAFTSATVNGITISAPAGTFNVGSGSVVFTAAGTPITTGFLMFGSVLATFNSA